MNSQLAPAYMQRRRRRLALIALVAAMLSLLVAAPLAAQSTTARFEVLRVDLRGDGDGIVAVRPAETVKSFEMTLTVAGEEIETVGTPLGRSALDGYTVLIVDDSTTADVVIGFEQIRNAALEYLDSLSSDTRVMLVRGGGGNPEVDAIVPFTANHAQVREAIVKMRHGGGAVLWNSIARSSDAFDLQGDGIRNVVAVIASPGSESTIPFNVAQGDLLNANAGLTVIAPEAVNTDFSEFERVAAFVPGGAVFRADSNSTIVDAAADAARFHEGTVVAEFDKSSIPSDAVTMEVQLDGRSERVRIASSALTAGAGLDVPTVDTKSRLDLLSSDTAAMAAIGLGVAAALLFSFAMMMIFMGNDNSLNSTLALYSADDRSEEEKAADEAFMSVRSKIVEQVVERAESAAESSGKMHSTASLLEKAEIPMRVGEAMAVQVGIILVGLAAGFLLTRSPVGALLFAIPCALFPSFYVKMRVKRRKKRLEAQLPDTLNLLSSTLKAGYSFIQGIDAVGSEAEEPLAGEFRRTVSEARLGKDVDLALDDLAERVGSVDLLWAVVAIKIQREVGGNLAELLSTVADTMTARTRLRGEVAALTAEGRMSAYVLIVLPIGVGVAMYFMNPQYISILWQETMGYVALGAGALGMIVGSLWMRKIIDIKI